jgi:hypothetical protein
MFYRPLQKLGVKIKYGQLPELASRVAKIETKERHVINKTNAEKEKLKKQEESVLKAIKVSVKSQKPN